MLKVQFILEKHTMYLACSMEIIQFFVMNYIHDHSVYTTLFLVCCELSKNTGSMEIIQVFFVNAMRSYRFNSCFIRSRS
jgi:hypothetical protein